MSRKMDLYESSAPESVKQAHERILKNFAFPGWYRDLRGVPCIMCRERLVSIYVDDSGAYALTVDTLDDVGRFDENVFWETRDTYEDILRLSGEVLTTICNQSSSGGVDVALRRLENSRKCR